MRLIGLTGGIGSGKSTVSALLAEKGAVVIDADAIVRELQRSGTPVFDAIVERFGPDVVGDDGELDRQALADIVFNDREALRDLNRLTHPAVGQEIARRLTDAAESDDVVVLDVPLLVESDGYPVETLVVVDCPEDVAVARLVDQRGMTEADARARIGNQTSREQRLARADIVIDNAGGRGELVDQVEDAWARIVPSAERERRA